MIHYVPHGSVQRILPPTGGSAFRPGVLKKQKGNDAGTFSRGQIANALEGCLVRNQTHACLSELERVGTACLELLFRQHLFTVAHSPHLEPVHFASGRHDRLVQEGMSQKGEMWPYVHGEQKEHMRPIADR